MSLLVAVSPHPDDETIFAGGTQHAMIRRNSKQQDVRKVLRRTEYFHRWPL